MNPMQILSQFMNNGGNPQQLLTQAMGMNNSNNAMINNLMDMASKGNKKGIEDFARNYMKERGMDFDKEFSNFMNTIQKR